MMLVVLTTEFPAAEPNLTFFHRFFECVDWNNDGSSFGIFAKDCAPGTMFDANMNGGVGGCNFPDAIVPAPACLEEGGEDVGTDGSGVQEGSGGASGEGGAGGSGGSGGSGAPGEFSLVCGRPGTVRHPVFCNQFYRCEWSGKVWSFVVGACAEEFVYDEAEQSCVPRRE